MYLVVLEDKDQAAVKMALEITILLVMWIDAFF